MIDSKFADNIALRAATCDGFESVERSFVETAGKYSRDQRVGNW